MLVTALFGHYTSAADQSSDDIWALDILSKVICELDRSEPRGVMS
jgi:hypothetical protein